MNTASLELCKELFEISGWNEDLEWHINRKPPAAEFSRIAPAYELGYLLRKLTSDLHGKLDNIQVDYNCVDWRAYFKMDFGKDEMFTNADTPENALCKLAIELFKQGILKREAS